MKNIAVLLPVHNHLDYTRNCVRSLAKIPKLSSVELSVVVIDDGSTDGTGEWLAANYPEIPVIRGDGNLWWSGGINAGARHAVETMHSDYLLLWNNDIHTEDSYFTELDRLVQSLPGNVIAGSKIYRKEEDNVIWSYGGIFNPKTGSKYMLGMNRPDSPEFEVPREVDWLTGMGTLVPVSAISTIGYWNEKEFPQYHGDSDFTYRAKLAGFSVRVYPQLKILNDTVNTGLRHEGSIKTLMRLLSDIKSNFNLGKNINFYRKYSTSPLAYKALIKSYFRLFGGFFKWKLLSLIGIRRTK